MAHAFVWFHNGSTHPGDSVAFYQQLLGCKPADAQVDDLDAATQRAVELGAQVLKERTRGPAGEYTIVRDPGGASVALWRKL